MASPHAIRQLGQRGRERDAGRQPDRRFDGAGHDHRQPAGLGDLQRRPHAAERLRLQHDDVGRAGRAHRQRVLGPPDRLVGRQRHVHPAAQRGQLIQRRARLLGVLKVKPGERPQHPLGLVDVPAAVGVDADLAVRADRVPDGRDPGDVVRLRLAGLGDLDLRGPAAGSGDDGVRLLRSDRRHGHVHRNAGRGPAPASRRRPPPARTPASGRTRAARTHGNGENSPHPAGPCSSAPSRSVVPRNLVGIGIANARRLGSSSAASPASIAGAAQAVRASAGHGRRGNLAKSGARLPT